MGGWLRRREDGRRTVIRRVFVGGEGWISGGREERSRDRRERLLGDLGLEGTEVGGETAVSVAMIERDWRVLCR